MKPHEKLGVAIANAGYDWTPEMRSAWEELDKTIAQLEKSLEERIKHSLCSTPTSIQSRVYVDNKEFSNLRMTHEEAKLAPQTKPLSDEEIAEIWKKLWQGGNIGHIAYTYARVIEERHGIK